MIHEAVLADQPGTVVEPTVRQISFADLADVLRKGYLDFSAKPSHLLFLGFLYPIIGLVITRVTMGGDLLPLLFPLTAGFALVGPLAAIAFYDVSRRLERAQDTSWAQAPEVVRSPSIGAIAMVAVLLTVIFVAWLATAQILYDQTLGPDTQRSIGHFVHDLLTTPAGWALVAVGNLTGAVFAVLALTVSVVSLPLLLDRDVGFATAITTSVRCMRANPVVLPVWGVVIGALLFAGSLPLFVGLAIVLPVLGHATWHLYRKLVAA